MINGIKTNKSDADRILYVQKYSRQRLRNRVNVNYEAS